MNGWEKRLALALLVAALALLINVWLVTNGSLFSNDGLVPATQAPPGQDAPSPGLHRG